VILQSVSEWQCDKVDWSGKALIFSNSIGPLTDRKKLNELNKLLHLSTIPKILVKIGPLDFEKQPVESRSSKYILYTL